MSIDLVKKSLHRFLSDNIPDTFITYNSNYADIKTITNIYSQQTLEPSNTSDSLLTGVIQDITGTSVTGNGSLFTSEINDGDTIKINGYLRIVDVVINDTQLELKEQLLDWNVGDNMYIPSGKEFVALQNIGGLIQPMSTDLDLTGWTVYVEGVECKILSYDSDKSQILLAQNCTETIQNYDYITETGSEIEISLTQWIYMKSPYILPRDGRLNCGIKNIDKYVLYVKTKNDNNKEKINNILQSINNIAMEGYYKFPIYDVDAVTLLAFADIDSRIQSTEIYDITNDIQSFMVEIRVGYTTKLN